MDEASLKTLLKTTGLPVAYSHFRSTSESLVPAPPYLTWVSSGISKLDADNKVFAKENNYRVELYSKKKDLVSEKLLEDLFDANDIAYDKSDDIYIESEDLLEVYYEI